MTIYRRQGLRHGNWQIWWRLGNAVGQYCPWTQNASNCSQRKLDLRSVERPESPSVRGSLVKQHNLTFQQDNARPHVARVCRDFLAQTNVIPLNWPSYSPILCPIERRLDELDRRVRSRRRVPNNHMPLRKINFLVNSMANRIREATRANGGHIRYWLWTSILILSHHTMEQFNRYYCIKSSVVRY